MRIADIETRTVTIPYKVPIASGMRGLQRGISPTIVRVLTDEGITGLGEVVGCPPYNDVATLLIEKILKPLVVGRDPFQIERILQIMEGATTHWMRRGSVFATCAIEMALFDILGKSLGTAVHNFFGGLMRESIPFAGYIFIKSPRENAQEALDYLKQGVGEIKMKVGAEPNFDIERVRSVREAIGNLPLRVDANQTWSPRRAIQIIRALEKYDIQYVEQPVPYNDLDGMADVARSVGVPIAADESLWTVDRAIEIIKKRAASVFIVRPEEAGGLLNFKRLIGIAGAANIPCVYGSWSSTGILTTAAMHVVASSRNFPFANDTHLFFFKDDILSGGLLPIKDGAIEVPRAAGLGIDLDEEKMSAYAGEKVKLTEWESEEWLPKVPKWY